MKKGWAIMASSHVRQIKRSEQRGAAAVEFALIAMVFFTLLLGIVEFGRFLYLFNTVQEVTRNAARMQVVRWVTAKCEVQRAAVFQGGTSCAEVSLPAGPEVTNTKISIGFYNTYADALGQTNELMSYYSGKNQTDNLVNCLLTNDKCIRFVRASFTDASGNSNLQYVPMIPLFSYLSISLPGSTVIMPAESMGL